MKNFSTYNFFFQLYFAYLDTRFEHAGTTVRAAVASLSHTHTQTEAEAEAQLPCSCVKQLPLQLAAQLEWRWRVKWLKSRS